MINGFSTFKEYFKGFENQYVVIGGTACDLIMESEELPFRATKDLDIVLIVESITPEFGRRFWEYVKEDIDIYITGSNSYIFSSQLATRLSGRYVEIPVLPFSFKEFYSSQKDLDKDSAFHEYMTMGGFPYITQAHLQDEMINMYMEGIYNTILVKAIEERINRKQQELNPKNITDVSLLKSDF